MFQEIKKTFTPPYNIKDLYSIFISLFILLAIPLTVLQITTVRDNRSNATTENTTNFKVQINSLDQLKTVTGTLDIVAEAMDDSNSIISVSLVVNGETVTTTRNQSRSNKMSTTLNWDTTKIKNGTKNVQVSAVNSAGVVVKSNSYSLIVDNKDTQKPVLSFIEPRDKAIVKGSSYKIVISAEDDLFLEKVQLTIDGKEVKTFTQVPYEYNWDLRNVSAGNHTLEAMASDSVGNKTTTSIKIYKSVDLGN